MYCRDTTDIATEHIGGLELKYYYAGLIFLAGLPRLREVHLDGLPGVTLGGTQVFPRHVRVNYST
jgi:hypothetical protein